MCTKIVIAGSIAGVGLLLAALGGGLGWGFFPSLIEDEITKKLVLADGSTSYENWVVLPQPMIFNVYIMEVTNPDEVHLGAKPAMREKGPFIYLEHKAKENVVFSEDGNTVEFEQRSSFEFSPELSGDLSDQDEVTMLNAALMGMILTPDSQDSPLMINAMSAGIQYLFEEPSTVFSTVKVSDLLFDGLLIKCQGSNTIAAWGVLCTAIKTMYNNGELPPAIRYDEITGNFLYSFFYHKNGKTDGHFKVMTGKSDIMKTGEIVEWENSNTLPYWGGPECNAIRGSDATIFPPFNNKDTKIYIFTTDLCRSIFLSYDKEITHEGIRGYRYTIDSYQLGNVTEVPENYCYCPPNGACLHAGAMDLTTCFNGPVILTYPHFLEAPHYLPMVDNLTPSKEEHQIFLDLEVHSGAPMSAGRRVQFNMMIKPVRGFKITENLPEALVPLIWINEALTLNEENTNLLKDELISKLKIVDGVRWGLVGVGAAAVVAGAAMFFVVFGSSRRQQRKMSMNS